MKRQNLLILLLVICKLSFPTMIYEKIEIDTAAKGYGNNTLHTILLECIEESKNKYENSIAWTQTGHKMYLNLDGLPDPNDGNNKTFYNNLPLSTVSWRNIKKYGKVFDVMEVYYSLQDDIIEVRIALVTVTRKGKKHYSHGIWFEDVDVYTYHYSCLNQQWERIPECIYSDVNTQSFVCIQNDSISIFLKEPISDNASFFYGTYQRSNDTLYLSDNLLKNSNAAIEPCLVIDDEHKTITISPQPLGDAVTNDVKGPKPIVLERRHKKTSCYRELKRWWLWLFGVE